MPFSPLPSELLTFLADLQTRSNPRIMDLGSGLGAFSQLLAGFDLPVWGLDRLPTAVGTRAHLQGDALHPPILSGSLDCILAGNLVRHLLIQSGGGSFLQIWLDLLCPGGSIFLFEDEPGKTSPAEKNFKELQTFLACLMPSSRGGLFCRSQFSTQVKNWTPGQKWTTGLVSNRCKPDVDAVCRMLAEGIHQSSPVGPAEQLLARIEKHGLSYGSFWWAQTKLL